MPALKLYDDTMKPNACRPMAKCRISCGPSGIMIMKSTICVKLMHARTKSSIFSCLVNEKVYECGVYEYRITLVQKYLSSEVQK